MLSSILVHFILTTYNTVAPSNSYLSVWDIEPIVDGVTFQPSLRIGQPSNPAITVIENNYVGIGTISPDCEFHVKAATGNADMCFESSNGKTWDVSSNADGKFTIFQGPPANTARFIIDATGIITLGTGASADDFVVYPNGKVAIGIDQNNMPGSYKLYVKEGILTEKLRIASHTDAVNWADFVFERGYELMPLKEVEEFIKNEKHLPDIPTANEVRENGIDVVEISSKLLQKIEELTLYSIDQDKRIKELQKQVEDLKKKK